MVLVSAFHISVPRFAHLFGNDAVSSRTSGLHRGGGQRPRQTLASRSRPSATCTSRCIASILVAKLPATSHGAPVPDFTMNVSGKNLFASEKILPKYAERLSKVGNEYAIIYATMHECYSIIDTLNFLAASFIMY